MFDYAKRRLAALNWPSWRGLLPKEQAGIAGADRHGFLPHRIGLIELAIFFIAAVAIERSLLGSGGFATISPHPFWIPVIVLSLQYGTADGLLAAVVAIGISLFSGMPGQGVEEEYFRYVIRTWTEPMLWIAMAIFIGELRSRQRLELARLERGWAETREHGEAIADHCERLNQKIVHLERDIAVSEDSSLDFVLLSMQQLETRGVQDWQDGFARLVQRLLGDLACTVYLRSGGEVTAVASSASPVSAKPAGALYDTVSRANRCLSLLRPLDAKLLGNDAALAAPLTTPLGEVIGLMTADTRRDSVLTEALERRFIFLAREISRWPATRGGSGLLAQLPATDPGASKPTAPVALFGSDAARNRSTGRLDTDTPGVASATRLEGHLPAGPLPRRGVV